MHLEYVLFTAMKKPLLNTFKTPVKYSLNSWGQGVTCIASQNGLRLQIGFADGRIFQPFAMATFLNKVTIPTQLYPFSVI